MNLFNSFVDHSNFDFHHISQVSQCVAKKFILSSYPLLSVFSISNLQFLHLRQTRQSLFRIGEHHGFIQWHNDIFCLVFLFSFLFPQEGKVVFHCVHSLQTFSQCLTGVCNVLNSNQSSNPVTHRVPWSPSVLKHNEHTLWQVFLDKEKLSFNE